jgi:type I restriction enzyme S subunit
MISRGPSVVHLAEFVNGNAYKPEDFGDSGTPVVRIKQLLDESAELELAPVPTRPVWLTDGDLVFSWSATLAVRFWNRGRALLNQHLFRVDVHPSVDRRWFAYVLEEGTRRLEPLMHGSAMTHITLDMLKSLTIALPPITAQRAIADLLDRETARIDALISAKRRMVVLLGAGLDAQLDRLIDPGHQPADTRVVPIRRVLRKEARPVNEFGIVTAFRDGAVMLRSRRREGGFTESDKQSGYQGVRQGDVVFHGLDGFAGAIGVAEDDGVCTPVYHVCSALPGFDAEYVALVLRALALSGFLALQSGNVRERAVDFRNWDALARIPVAIPSVEHQCSLARAYNVRRHWTDELTNDINRQTTLVNEHRQALITAAVTGQLDLPEAA